MTTSAPTGTQELHSRVGDGLLVRLLWRADDDHLFVAVTDSKENADFCIDVRDRAHALDVFHHPFAYAAHYGARATPTRPHARLNVAVSA